MRTIMSIVAVAIMLPAAAGAQMSDQEFAWTERGKDAVRAILKDGDSARFKDVFFARGPDDIPMTCGKVNAKNSFGGYRGYQGFISAGRPDLTFLQTQVSDFRNLWDQVCR